MESIFSPAFESIEVNSQHYAEEDAGMTILFRIIIHLYTHTHTHTHTDIHIYIAQLQKNQFLTIPLGSNKLLISSDLLQNVFLVLPYLYSVAMS